MPGVVQIHENCTSLLARPTESSSLQITNRSFTYAPPYSPPGSPILRMSPHHSHLLRSHHLSLPRPPDLKLISFTNPSLLRSHSGSFWNLDCIHGS